MVLGRDAEDDGVFIVELMVDADALEQVGEMPLPPYITAPLRDAERYQTVYSRRAASAAAPTAGLHFTDELMANVEDRGARIERVELVVGLDTFRPLAVDDVRDHRMHSEQFVVPREVMEASESASRVIAIGDADNDVPMLRRAGLGVAMGNAFPEVQAEADRVLDHHHTDAIGALVEDLLLR